jgi:hypothetical protein
MSATPSTAPAHHRRLRCRTGLHRWVQIKHEDTDLENPGQEVVWRTTCRYCGMERGSGLAAVVVLVGLFAAGGAVVWWLVSPVLGGLLIAGAVLGTGWAALLAALGRVSSFGFRYRG